VILAVKKTVIANVIIREKRQRSEVCIICVGGVILTEFIVELFLSRLKIRAEHISIIGENKKSKIIKCATRLYKT
jgi:hypothetical protein